jgi:hypothetical protein
MLTAEQRGSLTGARAQYGLGIIRGDCSVNSSSKIEGSEKPDIGFEHCGSSRNEEKRRISCGKVQENQIRRKRGYEIGVGVFDNESFTASTIFLFNILNMRCPKFIVAAHALRTSFAREGDGLAYVCIPRVYKDTFALYCIH